MLGELGSMSKNPPLIDSGEESTNYSTLKGCLASTSAFVVFFSTYFSSFESLVIMIESAWGEKCF
jgi:hypothetical protein